MNQKNQQNGINYSEKFKEVLAQKLKYSKCFEDYCVKYVLHQLDI